MQLAISINLSLFSNGMRSLQAGFSNRNPKYIPYPSTPPEYPHKPAVHTPHFEYSQPEPAFTAPESVYTPAEPVYSQPGRKNLVRTKVIMQG